MNEKIIRSVTPEQLEKLLKLREESRKTLAAYELYLAQLKLSHKDVSRILKS